MPPPDRGPRATFRDLFSRAATDYAAHRPGYPPQLFIALATRAPRTDLAWDCATGNGQAALGLAQHFSTVVATDASAQQIAAAAPHPRIVYSVALAEASGLSSSSVDLITVAQAAHWLDRERFYEEARRILVPNGVLAVWCYGLIQIDNRVDALVRHFYSHTLGPYWTPERRFVDEEYRTIGFPFAELTLPTFVIERDITLDQLAGYLRTWSATLRYAEAHHEDPVVPLVQRLADVWSPTAAKRARWPLFVRAGRAASGDG